MRERTARGSQRRRKGAAICAMSGKIRYRDGHEAGLALRSLRRRASRAELQGGSHSIRVQRKYFCPSCGGWHLTSQALGEWAWATSADSLAISGFAASSRGTRRRAES